MAKKEQQSTFRYPCDWGGAREGAGRPRKKWRRRVEHRARGSVDPRHPLHVTVRVHPGFPSLRSRAERSGLEESFRDGCEQPGFRPAHYVVLRDHSHWIVEADTRADLERGLTGLLTRIARRLNRLWHRAGSVFDGRYHARSLRTPREVRNALAYVLLNARKHGHRLSPAAPDPCSSGPWFDGWSLPASRPFAPPVALPGTWLLRIGWRRQGTLER